MKRHFKNISTVYLNINTGEIVSSSELNNETDMHNVEIAGKSEWKIVHNLETDHITIQVYSEGSLVVPDKVEIISKNEIYVKFNTTINGSCVIFPHYNTIDVPYDTI